MKSSKKILVISSEFPPQPGGIGNHAYKLAKHLTLEGRDVVVFTNNRSQVSNPEEQLFDKQQQFKIVRVKRFQFNLLTYVKRVMLFWQLLYKEKPTTILTSGKFSLWLVGFASIGFCKNSIAIIHGSEVNLKNSNQRFLVNTALERIGKIIAVSSYTRQLIGHIYKEVIVIPNGIETNDFESKVDKKLVNDLQLITVGALSQRKGQHNVISALPYLKEYYPNICYHMVGIPSDKEKLLQLANDLGVTSHITIHGIVPQKRLIDLLGNSDIFVMLSEETTKGEVEGFGIALLEANAMGIPTIGSKHSGIEDAILNSKSGILVTSAKNETVYEAIKEITGNYEMFASEAKKWAKQHEWKSIVTQYLKVIES